MRSYGEEYLGELKESLVNFRDSVDSESYSSEISQVTVATDRAYLKSASLTATADAIGHVQSVKDKTDDIIFVLNKFYREVDDTADAILKIADSINEIIAEANNSMVRIVDALNGTGDYEGQKVTSDILKSAGIDKQKCSEIKDGIWKDIYDTEIKNDVLTDEVVLNHVDRLNSLVSSGQELSAEDALVIDTIYSKYLESIKNSGEELSEEDKKRISIIYDYYVSIRFGANDKGMQNCIDAYELLNEDAKATTDKFFASASGKHDKNIDDNILKIKYAIYTCDPEYRDIILHYLKDLELNLVEGGASYSSGALNLDLTITNSQNYCSFFHEFGHALDDMSVGVKAGDGTDYSEKFSNPLQTDLSKHIDSSLVYLGYGNMSEHDREEIIDFIISDNNVNVSLPMEQWKKLLPSDWSSEQISAFIAVRKYYGYREYSYIGQNNSGNAYSYHDNAGTVIHNQFDNGILCDVIGGLTNNQIGGVFYSHNISSDPTKADYMPNDASIITSADMIPDYLKKYNYWYSHSDQDSNADGTLGHMVCTEFFAENFEYNALGLDLNPTRTVFSGTCDMFNEAIDGIYGGI